MKNILYLGFFILKTNYSDLRKSLQCTVKKGYSKYRLIFDMILSSLIYGSSFVDYFNFQFYRKSKAERKAYATMGIMYKFHKKVNDKNLINKVDDKQQFWVNYAEFCNKPYFFTKEKSKDMLKDLYEKQNKKIYIKVPTNTGGNGVQIVELSFKDNKIYVGSADLEHFLKQHFQENTIFYFEDFIQQHPLITEISPTAVNTIRVITMINDNKEPEIIGSVFRISVDCPIDNYSAGNMAAEIDIKSGVVITGGIRKRSSCDYYHDIHPITRQPIKGFQIPHWDKITKAALQAAMVVPQVRTVGWDIAVTENGPVFIEGNSQWNKDTWQIPAGEGKLHIIEKYL